MPAIRTFDLGLIDNKNRTTTSRPASHRSRDRDDQQRMAFAVSPNQKFSGNMIIQGTTSADTAPSDRAIWFDIINMELNNEEGAWSIEFGGEYMSIRVMSGAKDIWAAAYSKDASTVAANGTISINGISLNLISGDTQSTVANTINTDPAIIAAGNINAKVITVTNIGTVLRIITTDGTDLTLLETLGTPLTSLGITHGVFKAGRVNNIQILA